MIGQIVLPDGLSLDWTSHQVHQVKGWPKFLHPIFTWLMMRKRLLPIITKRFRYLKGGGVGFPYIIRMHTAYIGGDSFILGTWNVWWNHISTTILCRFFGSACFGTPKKYLPVIQLPGVTPAEARCSKKKTVEEIVGWKGSYVLGGSSPSWSAMGTHDFQLQFFGCYMTPHIWNGWGWKEGLV